MKAMGLQGVVRGKTVITTNPDTARPCPDDKVNRAFVADMPNQLWVSDFTCVSSWQGMVYVAFVIDVFARKIVGWRVSTSITTGFERPHGSSGWPVRGTAPESGPRFFVHGANASDRYGRFSIRSAKNHLEARPNICQLNPHWTGSRPARSEQERNRQGDMT